MNKLFKKSFALVLIFSLILGLAPVSNIQVLADGNNNEKKLVTDDGYVYKIKDDEVAIVGYKGKNIEIVIPAQIEGKPVKAIGERAFANKSLNKLVISDGIKYIKTGAFVRNNLKTIEFPDSVTLIGESAFENNKLESLVINPNIKTINRRAFMKNKLTELTIPNTIPSLGGGVFVENELTSVVIPDGFTSISEALFASNKLTNVVIPDSVKRIEFGAFRDNQLENINIPNSVTYIGHSAFFKNNLTKVSIPKDATYITKFTDNIYRETFDDNVEVIRKDENNEDDDEDEDNNDDNNNDNNNNNETIEKFTVKFLDKDGEIIGDVQKIEKGKAATAPTPPKVEGYTFSKWDKDFSNVTSNLSIKALYTKNEPEQKIEDYMFGFINCKEHFIGSRAWRYYIDARYFNLLTSDLDHKYWEKAKLAQKKNKSWGGSCYGMSAVRNLVKSGDIHLKNWDKDADVLRDFKAPVKDKNIENLINYYHLAQYREDHKIRNINELWDNQAKAISQLVSTMQAYQKEGKFMMIAFLWTGRDGGQKGHSVVGESIEKINKRIDGKNFAYQITVLDPNFNNQKNHFYISADNKSWVYDKGASNSNSAAKMIKSYKDSRCRIFHHPDPLGAKNPETYQLNPNRNTQASNRRGYFSIVTSLDNVAEIRTDQTYTKDDLQNSNEIIVKPYTLGVTSDGESDDRMEIILKNADECTIIAENKNKELDVMVEYNDSLSSVEAKKAEAISVTDAGDIDIKGKKADVDASIVLNDNVKILDKYKLEVHAKDINSLSISGDTDEKGFKIESDNLKDVKVYNSDESSENAVKFSTKNGSALVKTDKDNNIIVAVDQNDSGSYDTELETKKIKSSQTYQSSKASNTEEDKKNTSLKLNKEEALQMVAGFEDVYDHWAKDYIAKAVELGLFKGTSQNEFSPDIATTRAMLFTLINRMSGECVDTTNATIWYQPYMEWAKAKGISDGSKPEDAISREQLVTMLYRYANKPSINKTELSFKDKDMISDYAKDAISWAVENKLIKGNNSGKLNPQGEATRAEVATILVRFLKK